MSELREPRWRETVVRVPGHFSDEAAFLDLETVKVPAGSVGSEGFRMKSGELLRKRWSAFMAGVAYDGEIRILEQTNSEQDFLVGVRAAIGNADTVVYAATREFDEMILKGRFTNARRAHENIPFFPAMPGAYELWWRNMGVLDKGDRTKDTDSKGVWREYNSGLRELVLIHNLRDVAELILAAGDPDETCAVWCRTVLLWDNSYVYSLLWGPEAAHRWARDQEGDK